MHIFMGTLNIIVVFIWLINLIFIAPGRRLHCLPKHIFKANPVLALRFPNRRHSAPGGVHVDMFRVATLAKEFVRILQQRTDYSFSPLLTSFPFYVCLPIFTKASIEKVVHNLGNASILVSFLWNKTPKSYQRFYFPSISTVWFHWSFMCRSAVGLIFNFEDV